MKPRYLTKSRFKLALECPTKLFYTGKKEYVDKKLDDEFLQALAEGGFQVGELAKLYYPGGVNIEELDHEVALKRTEELLKQENVIVYEAAFKHEKLFIRADVIVKKKNKLQLIEVKAKSYDPSDEFVGKSGIKKNWEQYLYDVAFQKYVLAKSHPEVEIESSLMLVDKSKVASVDGLNQRFQLYSDNGRIKIKTNINGPEDIGSQILIAVNIDEIVNDIHQGKHLWFEAEISFEDKIREYSDAYANDVYKIPELGSQCGHCEFYATDSEVKSGLQSGYHKCWKEAGKFSDDDFKIPHVLKIWYFLKKAEFIGKGIYFQKDLTRADLESKNQKVNKEPGLSRIDRQAIQIEKSHANDTSPYIDIDGLKAEMAIWKFPLHFIDFETSAVAIPFNKGRHPYEQIAFQFSHHIVHETGQVEHKGEWISSAPGVFPNFAFVRALKKELESDEGTIFRYAAHENTILNKIYGQLQNSNESDKTLLCEWIKTITKSTGSSAEKWLGARNMVDLLETVKKYYYHPTTEGSNSIKSILPAILNDSQFLKAKYSKPNYGGDIPSKNFKDHQWIHFDASGKVKNPYHLLPNVFEGRTFEELDDLIVDDEMGIADGGAAMMAYAKMQFTEMSDEERQLISKALLRYCELDTLAMVMIYEAWREWCK